MINTTIIPLEAIVFLFLVMTGLLVARLRDLVSAAMLTGIFSVLSAGLFTMLDAVDVAFTEAAVGAGISTVLMLGTLAITERSERQQKTRALPFVVILLTGAVLIYGTLDMPPYGDPNAPIHQHVTPRYIEGSVTEVDLPNIVTSILGSYRGYDTFGETTVIFTAGIGVLLLLAGRRPYGARRKRERAAEAESDRADRPMAMKDKLVLRVLTKAFLPFILLFALYVQFHGDFGPGGGFQAGVIFAAGFILFGLIFGLDALKRVAPERLVEKSLAAGVFLFAVVGLACMVLGANFLGYDVLAHDPVHGQHRGIMLIEMGVGITVAASMLVIFYNFAGRSPRRR